MRMQIKTGCDIVEIKRFEDLDADSLNKIFHKNEMNSNAEKLAGVFAAKESCKKVFNELDWLDIEVRKKKNGKPELILNNSEINKNIISHDLSISHDKAYAIANVVFLIGE